MIDKLKTLLGAAAFVMVLVSFNPVLAATPQQTPEASYQAYSFSVITETGTPLRVVVDHPLPPDESRVDTATVLYMSEFAQRLVNEGLYLAIEEECEARTGQVCVIVSRDFLYPTILR